MVRGEKDFRESLLDFAEDVDKAIKDSSNIVLKEEVERIAVVGLGMNGVAGEILKNYLRPKWEVDVIKNTTLFDSFNSRTLVFILDFSGNGEDIIDAYRFALRKGCQIVGISIGGKLQILCEKQGRRHYQIPYGVDEKGSLPYMFFPMLTILHNSGLVEDQNVFLNDLTKTLHKDIFAEKGRELAKRIRGKVPLIYATDNYSSVAHGWKIGMNKISGLHAFTNIFPEVEYSDVFGFEKLKGYYYVIIIRDEKDEFRIKKRISNFKENVKKSGVDVIELGITGSCYLTKMFSALCIGFWAADYLVEKDILN